MRTQLLSLLILFLPFCAFAQDKDKELPSKYSFAYGDTVRTYRMYLPDNLKPDAPLVVYTHGYGSSKRWLPALNKVADTYGFAVCYPDGSPDSRGKDGWKVGYPPQESMKIDEGDFFRKLLEEVTARFNLSRDNVFMAGMSNGGDLCYQLAFTTPGLFKAYASVAGLAFEWLYDEYPACEPVPFMEIHGNADRTSRWEGDPTNDGGWGKYLPVPEAVARVVKSNGCTTTSTDSMPTLNDPDRLVKHTLYSGAKTGCDVELYEIEGGKHSWGAKDLPTEEIIWKFFSRYMK